MFHVGQRVVCVDAVGADQLQEGSVYTISDIIPCGPGFWRGRVYDSISINLHEASPNPGDIGFFPLRFRPITERKTDISIFTAMLTPKKVRVEA